MSAFLADPNPGPCVTPVVWVVFNRPESTTRSLAAIRSARPQRLYVVADGPRPDRPDDAALCMEVRAIVERGVDWPCDVTRDFAPANLGLARRVSSGLDAVFARETEAIIIEDDCIPDPTFFPFCTELLERYRDEPKVGQISGSTFQGPIRETPASYYFSRYPHCWGWATWRRAWNHYDHTMRSWQQTREPEWLATWVTAPVERRFWKRNFQAAAKGRIDSWAYRWTSALWQQGSLSISPYRNLVANIGFGTDATHTRDANPATALPVSPMRFPLIHPAAFVPNVAADERTGRRVYRRPSLLTRVSRRLRRVFT